MAYSDSDILDILEDFPHGGGEYYTEEEGKLNPDEADVTVTSASQLQSEAGPNHIIEIGADIDITGYEIDIGNSTLVGDRGWNGSDGPTISTDTYGTTSGGARSGRPYAALYADGSDTPRVTGIQMEGYHTSTSPMPYDGDSTLQRAIWMFGDGGEVDNCEFRGFTWCAVMVGGLWPSYGQTHGAHVHHCVVRLSMQNGYGYGVNFARGSGEVDHCYFNYNRHSINGQGRHFCSYTAEECIFGPDMIGHMIDQHMLDESGHSDITDPSHPDYGVRAGGATEVRDSTFFHGGHAVGTARGVPWEYFEINDCWISHSSIPTSNSGNSRTGAWYQQNVHGITGGSGTWYPRQAPDGQYTDEWGTSGNALGANNASVSWSPDVGASIDFENPENSPAYRGYDGEGEPTGQLRVYTEDADTGESLTGVTVTVSSEHPDIEFGSTVTLPGDTDSATVNHPEGIIIEPQRDLEGVRAQISSNASGFSRAWLATIDNVEFATLDVDLNQPGDRVMLPARLYEGDEYILWLDNAGESYTRGVSNANHPYPSDDITVTAGAWESSANRQTNRRYNFDSVQAILEAGEADLPEPPEPIEPGRPWPVPDEMDYDWIGPHDVDTEWEGYSPRPSRADADITTSSLGEFFSAIDSASSGDVIWLDDGEYQVDGESSRQDIPSDVTVASDGARIYTEDNHDGVFQLTNDGARLTGFRFEGSQETGSHVTQSFGVFLRADVQLDNCEFSRWMSGGVYTTSDSGQAEPHIHHCLFTDNRTDSMGYGLAVYTDSTPLIEYNYFNDNRHGLASNGADTAGYQAYNNLHGPDGMLFQFEQHAPGGDRMEVENNEFRMEQRNDGGVARAYAQRGTPNDVAIIDNNWIYNPLDPADEGPGGDAGISQTNHGSSNWVNVEFDNNHYGPSAPSDSSIGIQHPRGVDEFYDLSPDIPDEAWDLYQSKPDVREEYNTVSASGYENRSGDLGSLLQSASSDNAIVELDSGEYEMSSTLTGGGTMGLVGEGSDETTIYYTGSNLRDLINANPSNIVVEGVTFDISEGSGDAPNDVGIVRATISNEGWFQDILVRGMRDLAGPTSGGRFTFRIETQTSGTALVDYVRFPDGSVYRPDISSTSHAMGMNTDPVTGGNGLTVWKDCFIQDYIDNGMYIANHNNGRNILWNCHVRNCSSGCMRIGGGHDTIIGGTSIVDDLASESGSPLVVNHDSLSEAIGLHIEGYDEHYGADAIQIRRSAEDVLLDRVTLYTSGESIPVHFYSSPSTVDVENCFWHDDSASQRSGSMVQIGARNSMDQVNIEDTLRIRSEGNYEFNVDTANNVTIAGQSVSSGNYTADDFGLEDPRPLPRFYFSDNATRDPDDIIEDYWTPSN